MRMICLALLLSLLLAAPRLRAQPASAASLFQQGVALFQRGEIEAACSKFTQSYRLDAANGTLFNLVACYEKQGRFWTARGELLKLTREMDTAGKSANQACQAARGRGRCMPAGAPAAAARGEPGGHDQPAAPAALPGDHGVTGASWWTTKRTALGAGAYLFFSGGFSLPAPSSSAAGALRVLPTAGPGMAGVALDGRF